MARWSIVQASAYVPMPQWHLSCHRETARAGQATPCHRVWRRERLCGTLSLDKAETQQPGASVLSATLASDAPAPVGSS